MTRLELLKLVRSRRPVLAALSSALFLTLMLVGFYTYARTRTRGAVDFGYTFENESYFNGLTFTVYSFYFGFLLVLLKQSALDKRTMTGRTPSGGVLFPVLWESPGVSRTEVSDFSSEADSVTEG